MRALRSDDTAAIDLDALVVDAGSRIAMIGSLTLASYARRGEVVARELQRDVVRILRPRRKE